MASFPVAKLKAVNVNMKNDEITISLGITLSDENYEEAKKLERFLNSETAVVALDIRPGQMTMELTSKKEG